MRFGIPTLLLGLSACYPAAATIVSPHHRTRSTATARATVAAATRRQAAMPC
jgi:hypothetical protein